jgi:hypothetical protein
MKRTQMMNSIHNFYTHRIKRGLVRRLNNLKIASMARQVAKREPEQKGAPVVFFKASTGIDDLSWNSGFHLLTTWALRMQGVPVAIFACNAGMSHCVLGTNRDHPQKEPPCKSCVYQSETLYTGIQVHRHTGTQISTPSVTHHSSLVNWFDYQRDTQLAPWRIVPAWAEMDFAYPSSER